jgi:hypothetical protein
LKITVESTSKIVTLKTSKLSDGIECRVWEGKTDSGVEIHCFIPRVAVKEGQPASVYSQFETELQEMRKPSFEVEAIPLRMIL